MSNPDLEPRLVAALRGVLRRQGVTASVDDHKVTVYLSPERDEAETLVQALEAAARQNWTLTVDQVITAAEAADIKRRWLDGTPDAQRPVTTRPGGPTGRTSLRYGRERQERTVSFDEAAARERLRFRQLLNASSLGPSAWIVCSKHGFTARDPYQREECVWCLAERNAPEECGPCGHPAGWHLHGPETWGDCDGADCDCEMYTPRSEWDAVDFGAGWL